MCFAWGGIPRALNSPVGQVDGGEGQAATSGSKLGQTTNNQEAYRGKQRFLLLLPLDCDN